MAIEIGTVNTRAAYFDVIDGSYRFVGMGQIPTTADAPVRNAMIGVQFAIKNLQAVIGKPLMDDEDRLICPAQADGSGVDVIVTTISCGPVVKTMLVGLLADVSLRSVENLALSINTQVVDRIKLDDSRRVEEQVDDFLNKKPDVVLIAGGLNGGSTQFIQKILETIGIAIYLLHTSERPMILFSGNNQIAEDVRSIFGNLVSQVQISPNIRPSLDVEDLLPAQRQLANMVIDLRQKQMPELVEIRLASGGILELSTFARGRMVRFLSEYFGEGSRVLSVDVGASAVDMVASFGNELVMNVFPQLGIGAGLAEVLRYYRVEDILRWTSGPVSAESIRNYLYQKSIYPGLVPCNREELLIEQAVITQNLALASRWMLQRLPSHLQNTGGMLSFFEPVVVSGTALTNAPSLAQKLLILLNGLQPFGITTIAMDQHNLLSMLGASAGLHAMLPVQIIESGILNYLATVVSPMSDANYGTPVLSAKLIREAGDESVTEIKMGELKVLPLGVNQSARLQLHPYANVDVGGGKGHAIEIDVVGSAIGVVIDARGRPLVLPDDPARRRALIHKWFADLGG